MWMTIYTVTFRVVLFYFSVRHQNSKCYWWRKSEYLMKTTRKSQATDQLHPMKLYLLHFAMGGNKTHNF